MGLTQTQEYYLQTMGVDVYWSRDRVLVDPVSNSDVVKTASVRGPETFDQESKSWRDLRQRVAKCQQCELHRGRTQTVFGVGDHQAD
ncbi:MAG: hypothetical protein V3R41_03085, partial [Gammaproteobacteria bacterium]